MSDPNYRIQRDRTKCCANWHPSLATHWFAVLAFPDCVRRDLCGRCFEDYRKGVEERDLIFWKVRRRPDGKKEVSLDLVALRLLFDRLGEEDSERAAGLRYFVALLLLRKRALRMVDPINEAQEQADLVVADPKIQGVEPVALYAPDLDLDNLGGLKDELLAILEDEDGEPAADAV